MYEKNSYIIGNRFSPFEQNNFIFSFNKSIICIKRSYIMHWFPSNTNIIIGNTCNKNVPNDLSKRKGIYWKSFLFVKGKTSSFFEFKVHQYQVEKYFIFIKMKGLEVKLLGKRKKILTNMSYLLQRSLFYRFSFKKKGILNVSILHKFNV